MAALKKTDLYIKGLKIAWDEIDQNGYLRNIRTIAGISSLTFHAPITFFVGENGSGKSISPRYWKLWRSHMDLIRKAALSIIIFLPMILIVNCVMR